MQRMDHLNKPIGDVEPFELGVLEKWLEQPNVKDVRVFKLEKGMRIKIGEQRFKVTAVRANGKITMREIK